MSDLSILGVLMLGLIGGGLLGFLVGGRRRELFDRNLRMANTRLRSLELDRDLLNETLEITRRELDVTRKMAAEGELVVVLDQSGPAQPMPPKSPAIKELSVETPPIVDIGSRNVPPVPKRSLQEVIDRIRAIDATDAATNKVASGVANEIVEPDELADNAGRSTPEDVPIEVEEPDPSTSPDLEYPTVRFG